MSDGEIVVRVIAICLCFGAAIGWVASREYHERADTLIADIGASAQRPGKQITQVTAVWRAGLAFQEDE